MSKDALIALLGKPNSESITSGVNGYPLSETWRYGSGLPAETGGSVIFLRDKVMQCFMSSTKVN